MEDTTAVKNAETAAAITSAVSASQGAMKTSSGTASEALLKAVAASESSSGSSTPDATKAGDTTATSQGKPQLEQQKPDATAEPGKTAADTTVPPKQDGKPDASAASDRRDPNLENRFKAVASNARAQVYKDLGLDPKSLPAPAQIKKGLALLEEFQTDPAEFHKQLGLELKASGLKDEDEPLPNMDFSSEENYKRDFQKALEIHGRNIVRGLMKGPLKGVLKFVDGETKTRELSSRQAAIVQNIQEAVQDIRARPEYTKELETEMEALITSWPDDAKRRLGVAGCVYRAWNEVIARGRPALEKQIEERVKAGLQKKAAASGIHPSDASAETAKKPELKNQSDLASHMRHLEKTMA